MSNYKDKFPSKYIKVEDLNGRPLVVTVARVADELVGQDKDDKNVVYFREITKGLVLNRTNGESIAELANSEDVDDWPGARLQLYPAKTKYGGKTTPCIRVEAAPAASGRPPATTPSFVDELDPPENDIEGGTV
jgi:hypothetical protein